MCFWLPYPIGIGFLLLLSFVCMLFFDWRMAVAIFAMLPICTILMLQIAKVKENIAAPLWRPRQELQRSSTNTCTV